MSIKCEINKLWLELEKQGCSPKLCDSSVTDVSHLPKQITGLEFDSRKIKDGDLFVALSGTVIHGNKFVEGAVAAGAACALVEKSQLELIPGSLRKLCIGVEDSLLAFGVIASWWRREVGCRVLSITGSVGKTSTKEVAAQLLLSLKGKGYASTKSFNNHTGVPYTLSQLTKDDKWGVVELGMNHPGELSKLSLLTGSEVSIITCVAPVHIEFFDSIHQIADAKSEIIDGIKEGGVLVVNGDDEVLMEGIKRHPKINSITVKSFGKKPGSDYHISEVVSKGLEGVSFLLTYKGTTINCKSPLLGSHSAYVIAAAVGGICELFPDTKLSDLDFENLTAPEMRLNVYALPGGRRIIDDSYNASPISVEAALNLLSEIRGDGKLRIGAVLGDMLELGKHAHSFHERIGDIVAKISPHFLVTVGELSRNIANRASSAGVETFSVMDPEDAADIVLRQPYDILLIKGSRGMNLDKTVAKLLGQRKSELN